MRIQTIIKSLSIPGALLLLIAVTYMIVGQYTDGDWFYFREASLAVLNGRSPYGNGYYNAPWLAVITLPLALLPYQWGYGCVVAFGIIFYLWLGKGGLKSIFLLLSTPVLSGLLMGQIDPLIMLGAFMPPWIGAFFLLAKPQVGIGIILYWLMVIPKSKWIQTFAPVTLAYLISFYLYGFWIDAPVNASWNMSLFPYSIPFAVIASVWMYKTKRRELGFLIGPLLSPYTALYSYAGGLAALPTWAVVFLSIASWLIYIH